MLRHDVGSPVLFPCGSKHREELVTALRAAGRVVDMVEAYRTVLAPPSRAQTVMAAADILVVTSPAQARLLAMVEHRERPALVAIGPTTANEARRHGWAPDAVAASPVVSAVAAAIHSLLPSYT
jgi:uroporphyrinogen-III synthase